MNYLFDTNILLKFVRDRKFRWELKAQFDMSNPENRNLISIVSVGELKSLSLRNNWGERRNQELDDTLADFIIVGVRYMPMVMKYAEIDAFSQGKLKDKPLKMSSRNMGKNDLWIAATASLADARLVTFDQDFEHLNEVYFELTLMTN